MLPTIVNESWKKLSENNRILIIGVPLAILVVCFMLNPAFLATTVGSSLIFLVATLPAFYLIYRYWQAFKEDQNIMNMTIACSTMLSVICAFLVGNVFLYIIPFVTLLSFELRKLLIQVKEPQLLATQIEQQSKLISELQQATQKKLQSEELILMDGILEDDEALLNPQTIETGDNMLKPFYKGDHVYAGWRKGAKKKLEITSLGTQRILEQLKKNQKSRDDNKLRYVSLVFLVFAITLLINPMAAMGILAVICPCALGLAYYGFFDILNSFLDRKGIYLKDAAVLAKFNNITDVVFDKTGTLTEVEIESIELLCSQKSHDVKQAKINEILGYIWLMQEAIQTSNPKNHYAKKFCGYCKTHNIKKPEVEDFEPSPGKVYQYEFRTPSGPRTLSMRAPTLEEAKGTFPTVTILGCLIEGSTRHDFKVLFNEQLKSDADKLFADEAFNQRFFNSENTNIHVLTGSQYPLPHSIKNMDQRTGFKTSQKKEDEIPSIITAGKKVIYVGDGHNDEAAIAAVIAAGGVGVALLDSYLSAGNSEVVIRDLELFLNGNLKQVEEVCTTTDKVRKIVFALILVINIALMVLIDVVLPAFGLTCMISCLALCSITMALELPCVMVGLYLFSNYLQQQPLFKALPPATAATPKCTQASTRACCH